MKMTNPSRIDLTLRSDTNKLEPRKKKICLRIEITQVYSELFSIYIRTYSYIAVPAVYRVIPG